MRATSHLLDMYENLGLTSHLYCFITDKYGNTAPINKGVSMSIDWLPPTAGDSTTKKASNKGEVIFQVRSMDLMILTDLSSMIMVVPTKGISTG